MNIKEAAKLGTFIARDHAEDIFRLLVNYNDISASEAASRLNLHIKTVQDFLEVMTSLGILSKEEVYEKKRPYNRYRLAKSHISLDIDLTYLVDVSSPTYKAENRIREQKSANVRFAAARNHQAISSVVIWSGSGRDRQERKINLTMAQGKFLYHLPFPSAQYLSIIEIMQQADVENRYISEITDIVGILVDYGVIETDKTKNHIKED